MPLRNAHHCLCHRVGVIIRMGAVGTALLALALASCMAQEPTENPTSKPASTPTASPPKDLDINGLKVGPAPKVAWAQGTLLDGDPTKDVLPADVDQFARTKQLLVFTDDGNVYAYGPEGPVSHTPIGQATGRLAMNDERNLVAWIAPDGSPTVLQEGQAKPAVLEKQEGVASGDAVAVLGRDCFNGPETVEGAGCSVYVRSTDPGETRSFVSSNHGFVADADEGAVITSVQDAGDDEGVVGWTRVNPNQTTCSALVSRGGEGGEETLWKTCDHLPLSFSPDGRHLLATGPLGFEGLGAGDLSILDRASGRSIVTLQNNPKSQATIVDMQWEDDSHVLAVVTQRPDWAIVRVGLDGSMERAGKAAATVDEDTPELGSITPFKLSVQP
jgi:hypothetical protein